MELVLNTSIDNDELVDKLVRHRYLCTKEAVGLLRAVDRGYFFRSHNPMIIYSDAIWKSDNLEIMAPSIYCDVLHELQLRSGQSFLSVGLGTGYINVVAGHILGTFGVNHGIEPDEKNLASANEHLKKFISTSPSIDEYNFCTPNYVLGNYANINTEDTSSFQQYDKIYCGIDCAPEMRKTLLNMLKINGTVVLTTHNQLFKSRRTSKHTWRTVPIFSDHITQLSTPPPDMIKIPPQKVEIVPPSLQHICRDVIRDKLRQSLFDTRPELINNDFEPSSDKMAKVCMRSHKYRPRIRELALNSLIGIHLENNVNILRSSTLDDPASVTDNRLIIMNSFTHSTLNFRERNSLTNQSEESSDDEAGGSEPENNSRKRAQRTSSQLMKRKVPKMRKPIPNTSKFFNRRADLSKNMKLNIQKLPLPSVVKHFLNFYRDF